MKIGLLPLYIELYDVYVQSIRPRLDAFYQTLAGEIEKRGVEVVKPPFCRLQPEFADAVALFEQEKVDAIVTVHMAYSPSLESLDVLCGTKLPLVVLDTTETLEFTGTQDSGEINYCHGIHGVMDMCSMLKQRGKPYAIAAGHYLHSDCIDRALAFVKAAAAASALDGMKVGIVGEAFRGMGDFAVPYSLLLERFGIEAHDVSDEELGRFFAAVTEAEIDAEVATNEALYAFEGEIVEAEYRENIRGCLAVRNYIRDKKLGAFSVNFLNFDRPGFPLKSMPFMEACKQMQQGIGYAGEGDALTSSVTGALLTAYPETSFVEIFCPDWNNNMVFLSHMGEVNYRIADTKPVVMRSGKLNMASCPYPGYTRMKPGAGVYVNVSLDADGFQMLLAPARMLPVDRDAFGGSMRGWMRPENCASTAEFLEKLSLHGATHHSTFVYGATVAEMEFFARLLGVKCVIV